jgi:hypothetical protein
LAEWNVFLFKMKSEQMGSTLFEGATTLNLMALGLTALGLTIRNVTLIITIVSI